MRFEKQEKEEGREGGVVPRAAGLVIDSLPGDRIIYRLPEAAEE